jgi:hypothetical protein
MAGAFELPIAIRPSRWLAVVLYITHIGAILILLVTGLPLVVRSLLIGAVIINLWVTTRSILLQKSLRSPVQLLLNAAGEWYLTMSNGDVHEVALRPGAFVHPWLVVLPFRRGSRRPVVILTPDVVDKDLFRRLRVRLKFSD